MRSKHGVVSKLIVAAVLASFAAADETPTKPKAAVPAYAPQAGKLAEVRHLYAQDYADRTPTARKALAEKLFRDGHATTDDIVGEYVLLRESADLAVEAGDVRQTVASLDVLCERFKVDAVEVKADALMRLRSTATSEGYPLLAESAEAASEAAAALNLYDRAMALADVATRSAERRRDADLEAETRARQAELRAARAEFDATRPAAATLGHRPDDPQANMLVGRYMCLVQGDWDHGLPLVAKGGDPALSAIARAELTPPADVAAQVALGDAWWQLWENRDVPRVYKSAARRRACKWYRAAAPLATGLTQRSIQEKLKIIDALGAARRMTAVNLMDLVDLAKDASDGVWSRAADGLMCTGGGKLALPYRPVGEYEVTFNVKLAKPKGAFLAILPKANGFFIWVVSPRGCGLETVNGRPNGDGNPTTRQFNTPLVTGRAYTVAVRVRRANVSAYIDGARVVDYNTDYSDLAGPSGWALPDATRLGLAAWETDAAFGAVEVRGTADVRPIER